MALHEQSVGATDEWYTPPHVFDALGCSFDYDVASPGREATPWIPAAVYITADSLSKTWDGFVWMNPPFGARKQFAPRADLILFVSPKLKFIGADGAPGPSPAQGTCLLASGSEAMAALCRAANNGLGVLVKPMNNQR